MEDKITTKRVSSYQKMKQSYEAKVQSLTDDIKTLVENKDFSKVVATKHRWSVRFALSNMQLQGTPFLDFCKTENGKTHFTGFLPFIKKNDTPETKN